MSTYDDWKLANPYDEWGPEPCEEEPPRECPGCGEWVDGECAACESIAWDEVA